MEMLHTDLQAKFAGLVCFEVKPPDINFIKQRKTERYSTRFH